MDHKIAGDKIPAIRAEDTIVDLPELRDDTWGGRLPASLAKACGDSFEYLLKLRTGEVIHFDYAKYEGGDYVTLIDEPDWSGYEQNSFKSQLGHPCPRGIDVRLSDIVWCVDAPGGS